MLRGTPSFAFGADCPKNTIMVLTIEACTEPFSRASWLSSSCTIGYNKNTWMALRPDVLGPKNVVRASPLVAEGCAPRPPIVRDEACLILSQSQNSVLPMFWAFTAHLFSSFPQSDDNSSSLPCITRASPSTILRFAQFFSPVVIDTSSLP